jgi:hypothetical protein
MDERVLEAELHRIIGDALLSMLRQGEVEVEYTRALAVARAASKILGTPRRAALARSGQAG